MKPKDILERAKDALQPLKSALDPARESIQRGMEPLRRAYEGLNARERVLVNLLGGVFAAIVFVLPLYLLLDSIRAMEVENQELVALLSELDDSAEDLERQRLEREQAMARYARKAPALGGFVEAAAAVENLQLREVTDQPPVALGDFSRRQVRASLSGVGLRPVIKMLHAFERSDYPIATDRIQVDHASDGDNYTFQISVSAYDRVGDSSDGPGKGGPPRGKAPPTARETDDEAL